MNARLLPFLGFCLLFALLGFGIWYIRDNDINEVPSPLIGKPAPDYVLPTLYDPLQVVDSRTLRGKPYLLHVFASWCYVCREENPVLMAEGKRLGIKMVGFNYKDEPSDARQWLQQFGDPYDVIVADLPGKVAIDFGVYGAPEAFLIDGKGMIVHKHVGALTREVIETEFTPLLATIQ